MLALASTSKYVIAAVLCAPIAIMGARTLQAPPINEPQPDIVVAAAAPVDGAPWSALFIGPPRGQLEPCGCSGGQLGGIDRLQTMLSVAAPMDGRSVSRIASGGAVSVEAASHPAWARAQLETLWLSYGMMDIAMVGVAESDLSLLGELKDAKLLLGQIPLIATNIEMKVLKDSPAVNYVRTLFEPQYKTVTGQQIYVFLPERAKGVVGSMETEDLVSWSTKNAVQTLKELASQGVHDRTATTLALFEGTDASAAALASYLGKDSVVLRVNDEYEASQMLQKEPGSAATAALGTRFRYVVRLSSGKAGPEFELSTVSEDVPGDPNLSSMRGMYRMMLESYAARDAVAGSEGAAPRGGFAGSDSCAKCHVDAYEIWQESLHHHAMETLADDLRDGAPATQDPNCVECHSVGFGFDSGYGSKKLADDLRWDTLNGFAGVGCESCHGPGAQHVASANVADIDRGGEHTCLVCHDSENDPNFHFGRKWPNIEHNNE